MLDKIENMIREYPQKKMELKCLEHQIRNFRGISETDMIDSMCFSQPEGERVSTSNISDKTMKIGTTFRQRMEAINEEWYRHLEQKYFMLLEEIRFFEGAIRSIPGVEGSILVDMVFENMSWENLIDKYYVSRTSIARYRKKAISDLAVLYQKREAEQIAYMLS